MPLYNSRMVDFAQLLWFTGVYFTILVLSERMGRESTKELPMYIHKYSPSFLRVPNDWIHVYILSYAYVICSHISLIVHDFCMFSHVYSAFRCINRWKNNNSEPCQVNHKKVPALCGESPKIREFLCFKKLSIVIRPVPWWLIFWSKKFIWNVQIEPWTWNNGLLYICYIMASQPTPCKVPHEK